MKPLRLKNPKSPRSIPNIGFDHLAVVALSTPVPHLDGEYSYLATSEVKLGSLVKVPFGASETFGFVTSIESKRNDELISSLPKLKAISKIIGEYQWFDSQALLRYREIAENYGVGVFTLLNLAIPIRTNVRINQRNYDRDIEPSAAHQKFLTSRFGAGWLEPRKKILIVPALQLWEEILISILMSKKSSTLILLPTEKMIARLRTRLEALGFCEPAILNSETKIGERADIYQKLLKKEIRILIGTRSAGLAPFTPERVIILDSGDSNFYEKRSPYHRVDDVDLWKKCDEIIFLSHAPTLELMAAGIPIFEDEKYSQILNQRTLSSSTANLITDIRKNIGNERQPAVLISINDLSFSSSLICSKCRNRLRCPCGFPLILKNLQDTPFCKSCQVAEDPFSCAYCSHGEFLRLQAGGEKWALTLSKNIKGAQIIISNSASNKEELIHLESDPLIVIATHGSEPLIFSRDGRYRGYDFVTILGGDYGFNSPSLNAVEELRVKWSRILSLANRDFSYKYKAIVDLDSIHIEFKRLIGRSLEDLYREPLAERKSLALPPFTAICEVEGNYDALARVRSLLSQDPLFLKAASHIYPVRPKDGVDNSDKSNFSLLLKVEESDRKQLAALLQQLIRLRSAKRLTPLKFRMNLGYL